MVESQSTPFNPDDHNVSDIVDYLKTADAEEVARVKAAEKEGEDRVTVSDFEPEPVPPTPEDKDKDNSDSEKKKDKSEKKKDKSEKKKEEYDPLKDNDIPSSALAQVVAIEMKSGKSPTLDAIREGKK